MIIPSADLSPSLPPRKSPTVAFIHGRPAAHWFHNALADSVGARRIPVDFRLRWNGIESAPRWKRHMSALVCSLAFPDRGRTSVFLSEGSHTLPVLMRRLGLLRRDQRTVALMDNETLYFLKVGFYSSATNRFLRTIIRSYDALVCIGEMQAALALECVGRGRGAPRIWTVPSAMAQDRHGGLAAVEPALEKPSFLFIGNLTHRWRAWYKGVDLLIAAMRNLAQRHPGMTLRIVGELSPECSSDIRTAAGPEAPWLTMTGSICDLGGILADSGLYVHLGRGEAFGITALEAMRAGVPAVVSEWTGAREAVLQVDPRLVVPLDDSIFAERIEWYLGLSREERLRLSRRSREVAGQYTVARAAAAFVEAIGRIHRGE